MITGEVILPYFFISLHLNLRKYSKNINKFVTKTIWMNTKNSDLGYASGRILRTRLKYCEYQQRLRRTIALAGNEISVTLGSDRSSLRVAVPSSTRKNGRKGTSTKSWHESCYVTSRFCKEIYNGFLLDKGGEQYFREYFLAKDD